MTRLATAGFEWANPHGDATDAANTSGSCLAAAARSGGYGLRVCSSDGLIGSRIATLVTGVFNRAYFARAYVRTSGTPASSVTVVNFGHPTSGVATIVIDASRQIVCSAGSSTVRYTSSPITVDQWYYVEVKLIIQSGAADDTVEFRIDGVSVYEGSALSIATLAPTRVHFGGGASGHIVDVDADDCALNDDQGSLQNSWPGEGSVVLLRPTADAQRGSWTGGVGGTTNLFDAVDNVPPVGTATETNTTQIESADTSPDNAIDEYRATMQTYLVAGIGSTDTLVLAQAHVIHGEDVATGTKTGSVTIASNPTQSGVDAFTFGNDAGALGTFGTATTNGLWRSLSGTAQDASGATKGTAPEVRLRKTDTGSRVASVCALGVYVEYIPAVVTADDVWPAYVGGGYYG